ncbi:DedA family protein [Nitratiruptor tergarcus]|uniref:Membrane protein DedA, SNARE-associated domain n=1 Tax=Nitratiruptor tergarcus DSM 16512 TaxID=1069081 RepID=A0A1W1WRQ3_9BACT|nr:DedA family protein [Nitratiruptor tergarcus]SMC08899.1 membrane protein DedA, SNARE-associated domain [Nitratiruptor tergarcus DSM 16512]
MHDIVAWVVNTVGDLGYIGIFVMMFLESSFFPFPSEVAMVPAGYLASKGEMSLIVAWLAGAGGSLAGALFNYYLGHKLGRPFLEKYGKYLFLKEESLKKVEDFFEKYGHPSTFWGRLIPGIRQYISLPAGIGRMKLTAFAFYTFLGAGLWCAVLLGLGYFIGENEEKIKSATHIIIAIVMILVAGVFYYYYRKNKKCR